MRALNFQKYSKTTDYSIKPVLPMRPERCFEKQWSLQQVKMFRVNHSVSGVY